LLYSYITEADNNKIGKTNTYSHVGIIKNPEFTPDPLNANTVSPNVFDNRIAVTTDEYAKVIVNGVVTQTDVNNDVVFSAIVHEIKPSANTIYLSNYMGPYTNQANNDISLDFTKDLVNQTGQRIKINTPVANNVIESRYTQRSGTVYFMEDFFPLERAETSREEYKLVLEF
jgi:phosphopantetheine adenylyltransferase